MRAHDPLAGHGLDAHRGHAVRLRIAMLACAFALVSSACELDVTPRTLGASAAPGDAGEGLDAEAFEEDRVTKPDADAFDDEHRGTSPEAGAAVHADASVSQPPPALDAGDSRDQPDAAVSGVQLCAEDEQRAMPCGLNGRGEQRQTCIAGEFRAAGSCSDPDVCTDEAVRAVPCGPNGNGSQAQRCDAGQWHDEAACDDTDACVNDQMRAVPCGLNGNGTQAQRCTAGMWQESGPCSDPDACVDGQTRTGTCGPNGHGMRPQRCVAGQWQNDGDCADEDVCMNGAARAAPCGVLGGGTLPQLCVDGQWQDDGACDDPDWTCSLADYGAGNGCDCDCGSRDPDCDAEWHDVLNCADEQFCNPEGACEDVPGGWECAPGFYATLDGCDCDCGVYDPDCAVAGQTVIWCSADETCNAAGECESD